MRRIEVVAIGPIEMEAHPDRAGRLTWFYVQLIGLRLKGTANGASATMFEFLADLGHLRIQITPHARTSAHARKALLAVPSLVDVVSRLTKARLGYHWISDFCFTSRKISLLDPAGNRVELKQHWPPAF